MKKTLKT